MPNLQVLQLCYNQFTGSIPTQLGSLKKLSVLALQSNLLTGAIPASLGNLVTLTRLDLSFNRLFGSIPKRVAHAPLLQVFDVRNNSLSGSIPAELKKLNEGFKYSNNLGLCGADFQSVKLCNASGIINSGRHEPYGPGMSGTKNIPETANVHFPCTCNQTRCSNTSRKSQQSSLTIGILVLIIGVSAIGVMTYILQQRREKQKLGYACDSSDTRVSKDHSTDVCRKTGSRLISLEYSNWWDPLANDRNIGAFSQEVLQSFKLNLEEVESATNYFSDLNLLGKSKFSMIYKGVLRDGSVVAIKSVSKTSCKSDEGEFLNGLHLLTSLRHENLVRLRGFCSSRARGECFLVYDFVPNGNLLRYLDTNDGEGRTVLEWSTRVAIINGIAKGIEYLHTAKVNKLVHQNISAEKVLIDKKLNPLLACPGLHKLLTNDIVFSTLKASAAQGYLAPEYTTTGRFSDKSDVYAFGILALQVISGKRRVTGSVRIGAETRNFPDFIDSNLSGTFSEHEADKIARIALACTHESPNERPCIEMVVQELGGSS